MPQHEWRTHAAHGSQAGSPFTGQVTSDEPAAEAVDEEPPDLEALRAQWIAEAKASAEAELEAEREQLRQTAALLQQALDEAARARRQALEAASNDIGELVIAMTERVLDTSMAVHPDALRGLVSRAIEQLPEAEEVAVMVVPGQVEQVSRALDPRCRIVPDPEIGSGCIVRPRLVKLDATLEATMSGIKHAVKSWLSEQPWVTDWMIEQVER